MISRLRSLFKRYADHHLETESTSQQLLNDAGEMLGNLDIVRRKGNRIEVAGWTLADRVVAQLGEASTAIRPSLKREDVANALGVSADVGFTISLPVADGAMQLRLTKGSLQTDIDVPLPDDRALRGRARGKALRRAVRGHLPDRIDRARAGFPADARYRQR